jgi:Flp pilus assembly protein TadD
MSMKNPIVRLALGLAFAAGLAGCASQPSSKEIAQKNLLASGENAELHGDYDQALVQYVQLLGEDPENVDAHYRIGRVHAAIGNGSIAREAFSRVLGKEPGHVGALEGLGLLYLEEGQHDSAAAMLHKALAKDSKRWRSYNGLGVLADLKSNHALAQAYFDAARKLRPADPTLVNNLGYSYYLAGDLKAAQREFERAIAVDPKSQKAWSNLGLVLARQGNFNKAVMTLEHIMAPKEARYSVGYICMLDGKLAAAEALFKEAIKLSSSYDPAAQAALKRVHEEQQRRN